VDISGCMDKAPVAGRHFSQTLIHSLGLLKGVRYGGRERCRWPTDQGGELAGIVE
jgi:hypothetical protein